MLETEVPDDVSILAKNKHVIVIGGGDTGSDCVGTSLRHGARSVTQLEMLPQPPERENKALTWPDWPMKLRTSSSHEEGCDRDWSVMTKSFTGTNSKVTTLNGIRLEWAAGEDGRMEMQEVAGSEFELQADLVLLAMGFLHPVHEGMLESTGVKLDPRETSKQIRKNTARRTIRCLRQGTCGAVNRLSSGRFEKVASAPVPSMNISWDRANYRGKSSIAPRLANQWVCRLTTIERNVIKRPNR